MPADAIAKPCRFINPQGILCTECEPPPCEGCGPVVCPLSVLTGAAFVAVEQDDDEAKR
jgi:hypothetical protein